MNDNVQPYPPLAVISARLWGEPARVDHEMVSASEAPAGASSALPDWLRSRIRQVATQRAQPVPVQPEAGQIWSLAYLGQHEGRQISGRLPVLLDQPLDDLPGEGGWSAWVLSHDVDYAASDDVILDAAALSISPFATVVQTWNSVQVTWSADSPCLGQLPAAELAGIRQLAMTVNQAGLAPGLPGQTVWRSLPAGGALLTGQPLGDAHDPRWAYRQLYREFALAVLPELSHDQEFDV